MHFCTCSRRRMLFTRAQGEYLVFSKPRTPLLRRPIQPVPTPETKGVYVFPSLYGNIVVGPTAVDQDDRQDATVSPAGMELLLSVGARQTRGAMQA